MYVNAYIETSHVWLWVNGYLVLPTYCFATGKAGHLDSMVMGVCVAEIGFINEEADGSSFQLLILEVLQSWTCLQMKHLHFLHSMCLLAVFLFC